MPVRMTIVAIPTTAKDGERSFIKSLSTSFPPLEKDLYRDSEDNPNNKPTEYRDDRSDNNVEVSILVIHLFFVLLRG